MLRIILSEGGPMIWLLLAASAVALVVFIQRILHFHRAQINSMEFLNGVADGQGFNHIIPFQDVADAI